MKAIILCAGKSTRMHPLTLTRPKPLLKILNKTILSHNLEQLKGIITEAIIVVGYKKEMIIDEIGENFQGIKIAYVEQKEQLGTGHAVLCSKDFIKNGEKFLIAPGDDLFSKKDIQNLVKYDLGVLAKEVDDPQKWGIIVADKKGNITDIEEKPDKPKSNLASTGLMVMDYKLVNLLENLENTKRGEIEIPCAIRLLIKKEKVFCQKVEDYWLPIGYPWHILIANEYLLSRIKKSEIKGKLSKAACVEGKLILGKGSEILMGVHIEGNVYIGENTKIGPNCYIRGATTIGNSCRVGQAVELKNSVVGDFSKIPHLSYVGDSVIGNGCNLGAGTITANLRHNHGIVKTLVKEELVETGRKKFGAVLGDNVHTGINTSIYPGRKLWPNVTTKPGEVVDKDKTE
jgi:UDP-N-acetylglucosamine diphosphorylase / glucose-1-phosphate thymidylyltransferase / UDP-N-acetylgalactosamine diphosphorylase / glucosamine-1-phosphate N-acetyltransferase / galactosamine-1-phosphate N-acetyltransferase